MSQNVERAKAVLRAKKLMTQTTDRGRTVGEADYAFKQLSQLMETFNITLDEVAVRGQNFISKTIDTDDVKRGPMNYVVSAIAAFTDTVTYRSRRSVGNKGKFDSLGRYRPGRLAQSWVFFGIDSDVEMAEFLFNLIQNSIASESLVFRKSAEYLNLSKGRKRSALHSFGIAMAINLSARLYEEKGKQVKNVLAASDNAIVFNKMDVINDEFKNAGVKLTYRRSASRGITSSTGANAGSSAANNVSFSRPVSNSNSTLAIAGY